MNIVCYFGYSLSNYVISYNKIAIPDKEIGPYSNYVISYDKIVIGKKKIE